MVLNFDLWGMYCTYEEAVKVGRVSSYEKLCVELEIPILSPEVVEGSFFTRANWIFGFYVGPQT